MDHRVTSDRHADWECVFVADDDHSRIAFTHTYPDETQANAVDFLRQAVRYFARLEASIERALSGDGSVFRSAAFAAACQSLGIAQEFTRVYRPQTNDKVERLIQSALRELAYSQAYENSDQRQAASRLWTHFYNLHQRHHGINCLPPMSRLLASRKNLLTLHT